MIIWYCDNNNQAHRPDCDSRMAPNHDCIMWIDHKNRRWRTCWKVRHTAYSFTSVLIRTKKNHRFTWPIPCDSVNPLVWGWTNSRGFNAMDRFYLFIFIYLKNAKGHMATNMLFKNIQHDWVQLQVRSKRHRFKSWLLRFRVQLCASCSHACASVNKRY